MKVLVTGGAGYVGSTICSALIDQNYTPIILDSLTTGKDEFVEDKIFYKGSIDDKEIIDRIFSEHGNIKFVIHCAEKSSIDISVSNPYEYYNSNVVKSIELFKILNDKGCKNVIFCSSASIYDDVAGHLVTENSPINPRSPFARSKYITEMILQDFVRAYDMKCIALRCFNPIGADPLMRSGITERNPHNIVYKLLESVSNDTEFVVGGNDWPTKDGTCIRDYIHIFDVALAHVKALENFDEAFLRINTPNKNYMPINIGSGRGSSVKELIYAFENITGEKVKVVYGDRRPGDAIGSYANISRAKISIDWDVSLTMEEGILDAIRWKELSTANAWNVLRSPKSGFRRVYVRIITNSQKRFEIFVFENWCADFTIGDIRRPVTGYTPWSYKTFIRNSSVISSFLRENLLEKYVFILLKASLPLSVNSFFLAKYSLMIWISLNSRE